MQGTATAQRWHRRRQRGTHAPSLAETGTSAPLSRSSSSLSPPECTHCCAVPPQRASATEHVSAGSTHTPPLPAAPTAAHLDVQIRHTVVGPHRLQLVLLGLLQSSREPAAHASRGRGAAPACMQIDAFSTDVAGAIRKRGRAHGPATHTSARLPRHEHKHSSGLWDDAVQRARPPPPHAATARHADVCSANSSAAARATGGGGARQRRSAQHNTHLSMADLGTSPR